jgi:hypothetical protein
LAELPIFNAVTVNPDFGCVEWPGGVDLCTDAMHQAGPVMLEGASSDRF